MKRCFLFILTATLIAALAGCSSGGGTFNVQNPPPPPPAGVSIVFHPTPPTSVVIGSATPITAVVTNDSTNAGVAWKLTCQSSDCGTLSTSQTQSGQATIYTPPTILSGNSEIVNISGFSIFDNTKNILASINVTAFGSNLVGTYVFEAQGVENFLPYQIAGAIVLDGNGHITSGQQTINFNNSAFGALENVTDSDLSGTYFLGPDGRGTLTINTGDKDIDPDGVSPEIFGIVYLSSSQLLLSALPANYFNSTSVGLTPSGTGTMTLQTNTVLPSGGYTFAVSGADVTGTIYQAFGGILDVESNNIMTSTSVMDGLVAINGTGLQPVFGTVAPSGTVSSPTANGVVTISLTANFPATNIGPQQFTYTGYVADPDHIMLIESDGALGTAGLGLAQGVTPGSISSFSGTYVFGVLGDDLSSTFPNTFTAAGIFDADAGTGYMDASLPAYANPNTGAVGLQVSASFTGTTNVDAKGIGRVFSTFSGFTPRFNPSLTPFFVFYLTGNGNPVLFLADGQHNYPFLGAGMAYPQLSTPTFSGNYGMSFTQQNGTEEDGTAQMNANPSTTPPSLTGVADGTNGFGGNQSFTGTFGSPNANGAIPGILESTNSTAFLSPTPFNVDFYPIDGSIGNPGGFFVETDLLTSLQVTFGYYAAQCPVTEPPTNTTECPAVSQAVKQRGKVHK